MRLFCRLYVFKTNKYYTILTLTSHETTNDNTKCNILSYKKN